jgi:hypothetical protein
MLLPAVMVSAVLSGMVMTMTMPLRKQQIMPTRFSDQIPQQNSVEWHDLQVDRHKQPNLQAHVP